MPITPFSFLATGRIRCFFPPMLSTAKPASVLLTCVPTSIQTMPDESVIAKRSSPGTRAIVIRWVRGKIHWPRVSHLDALAAPCSTTKWISPLAWSAMSRHLLVSPFAGFERERGKWR